MRNIVKDEIARLLVLKDNGSPYGGTSHQEETLGEFIDETCYPSFTLKELNDALNECGIQRIATSKSLKESVENYFLERIEVMGELNFSSSKLFLLTKYLDNKHLAYWVLKDIFNAFRVENTVEKVESLSYNERNLFLNAYIYFNYR